MIPQATMKGMIVWNMAGDRRRLWHVQDTRCSTHDRTNKIGVEIRKWKTGRQTI